MFRASILAALVALPLCWLTIGAQDAKKGKKYALLVGVTDYNHRALAPLKFTENDVEKLAEVLKSKSGFDEVRLLTSARGKKNKDDAPTAANLRKALAALIQKKGRDDVILVALSGHGVQLEVEDRDGKEKARTFGFFCPSDADLAGKVEFKTGKSDSLLNVDHLFEDLGGSGAGAKLVLMDACRNELKGQARNLDVNSVKIPEGVAALFSCKPGQRAFESGELKQGVFFHRVLKGLEGEAADRKGRVTWGSLSEYVTEVVQVEVPKLIGGGAKQTPHEIKNLIGSSPILATGIRLEPEGASVLEEGKKGKGAPPPAVVIEGEQSKIDDEEIPRLKADYVKRNKTELLRDILLDLPTTLYTRARAHDSDDYDAETGKLAVDVEVMPNRKVYDRYVKQLEARLGKIKLATEETTVRATATDLRAGFTLPKTTVKGFMMPSHESMRKLRGPDLTKHADAWCVWVMRSVSEDYEQTHWVGYVVDADPVKALRSIHGELKVKVDLLDAEGGRITGEELDLSEDRGGSRWLGSLAPRRRAGDFHLYEHVTLLHGAGRAKVGTKTSFNAYVGPMLFNSFSVHFWNGQDLPTYAALRTYRREYKVTKEEFKKLKTIRCTLVFKKTTPKEK